ncbi:hypothetical protein F4827_003712 [Paraburkholderia bannensis]|uniref:Uncharacterized protein n=1 Tax=Paraburkholderia bannensis TaxID=765414 RepID=A0A7W9WTZ7_9BURK|nr:hypothetical protein [Paraburkholderia sp. WP4_3_2]MBB6103857.1 hypothetical protein [Paraburkholderia bannensis]
MQCKITQDACLILVNRVVIATLLRFCADSWHEFLSTDDGAFERSEAPRNRLEPVQSRCSESDLRGPARATTAMKSGVLLGAEIALIVDSFRPRAALVVLAIGRHAGRGAILAGGIGRVSRREIAGTGSSIGSTIGSTAATEIGQVAGLLIGVARATFARVTCGPAQSGMSHVDVSCVLAVTRRWHFYSLGIAA